MEHKQFIYDGWNVCLKWHGLIGHITPLIWSEGSWVLLDPMCHNSFNLGVHLNGPCMCYLMHITFNVNIGLAFDPMTHVWHMTCLTP